MPNVTRGDKMVGLLVYLAGPGKHNEHTDPHLVAGDPALMAWHDDEVLDRDAAVRIAHELEAARRIFDVDVPQGAVFHCSLSLSADEGVQTDELWAAIAHDYVEAMGFTEASGKAPCRWVAVRHGLSGNGNDHIHIAVSLVREDGTKETAWQSMNRSQRIAGELEVKYGLQILESRQEKRTGRGVKPAEVATAAKREEVEPARASLARTVRGCASASADEAEFVRRLRRGGLLVRPRYAAGRGDVVAGYSVARRAPRGERPIWYGGGHLAHDLTLPRLRAGWPDTPHHAGAAVAEWASARRNRRIVAPGRETRDPDPALWQRYTQEIGQLREHLRSVPIDDHAAWAGVARETAGAFAAWSMRVEATPGPLAATADALARSAQTRDRPIAPQRAPMPSLNGAAMLLASLADGDKTSVAQTLLLIQLANTMKALHDAHQAAGQAQRAAQIAAAVRTELVTVAAALPPAPTSAAGASPTATATAVMTVDEQAAATTRLAGTGQSPIRPLGTPLPADLRRREIPGTAPHTGGPRQPDSER